MLLLALSCNRGPALLTFSDDFQWGVATAGFQVEPGCEGCTDTQSDWYQWVTDPELVAEPGLFLSGDPLELGPGHLDRYEADLDLAADELGVGVFRFSFEWSRLFPASAEAATTLDELDGLVDADARAWYHAYLDAMSARGLEPMATVNHYTLPLWVHDGKACYQDAETCTASGWLDHDRIQPLITLFSGWLAREYGADIRWWLTLNEPLAVILSGYILPNEERTNPPGISDAAKGMDVAWSMARSHASMADAIRAQDSDAQVGVVVNLGVVTPDDPNDPEDVEGAEHMDYVYNTAILEAFLNGNRDANLDGSFDDSDPNVAGKTDWLGLNYYFGFTVSGFANPLPGFEDYPYMDFYPIELNTDPALFGDAIDMTAEWGLPIWITENGVADPEPADVDGFLIPALREVHERQESADIRGYLYWSLIDNYEWNHGMGMRFGLYEVDTDSKERTLRPIGAAYQEIVADGLPLND